MLEQHTVIELYRLILDREPENDKVVNEKRMANDVLEVALAMFSSDEFVTKNKDVLKNLTL